ncbi:hypothetical protein E2562_022457 [Oryza meyeriana var. granulata]|uniref:F-box domain-containing protein n=1 Tax=Oryza meyeriana var. granulata TaxID=110450 RepID=A0A6G1BMD9_9ORYZ|nr:hypothetical protein E2562_022457 [Oryza meyeriana var. granulata]
MDGHGDAPVEGADIPLAAAVSSDGPVEGADISLADAPSVAPVEGANISLAAAVPSDGRVEGADITLAAAVHSDRPVEGAGLSLAAAAPSDAVPGGRPGPYLLSELPDDLLIYILLLVNQMDSTVAARTMVLSRRWVGLWAQNALCQRTGGNGTNLPLTTSRRRHHQRQAPWRVGRLSPPKPDALSSGAWIPMCASCGGATMLDEGSLESAVRPTPPPTPRRPLPPARSAPAQGA